MRLFTKLQAHTVSVAVAVDGDDFSVAAPRELSVPIGGSSRFQLATTTTHGAPQMLSGRVQAASPGIAVTFDPPSVLSGSPIAGTVSGSSDLRGGRSS